MNNFFENHLEEIKIITARSRKESRKSFSRLQKATEYFLRVRNGITLENEVKILEGINVHQYTNEGKVLIASSDRIYLPDVATRLYQGLDNILKSYKSHKVHEGFESPGFSAESNSQIDSIDLSEWENEYLVSIVENAFNELSENSKKFFDIELSFEGHYSIWNIFNPESKNTEFDEYFLVLNYKIFDKENNRLIIDRLKKISNVEIRNKKIDLTKVIEFINDLAEVSASEKVKSDDIDFNIIVFGECLTGSILLSKLSNTENSNQKIQEFHESTLVNEIYDRFGNKLQNNSESDSGYIPRQTRYYSSVEHLPRNFSIDERNSTADAANISEIIKTIESKYKGKKFIYVLASEHKNTDHYEETYVVNPSLAIYFDGKKSHIIDIDFLEVANQDDVNFSDETVSSLLKLNTNGLLLGMKQPQYSYISSDKVILA